MNWEKNAGGDNGKRPQTGGKGELAKNRPLIPNTDKTISPGRRCFSPGKESTGPKKTDRTIGTTPSDITVWRIASPTDGTGEASKREERPKFSEDYFETIFSLEIRRDVAAKVQDGVKFFDAPPVLLEAATGICKKLEQPPSSVEYVLKSSNQRLDDIGSLDDYARSNRRPDTYFTYNPTHADEATIHVGINPDGKVSEIVYEQRNNNGETTYESAIIFHGFEVTRNQRGVNMMKMYYYNSDIDLRRNSDEWLPPVGAFVDYRCFDQSGDLKARAYGSVRGSDGPTTKLSCFGDKEIFPFLQDSSRPEAFAMVVDNKGLGNSIRETLTPDYLSQGLLATYYRLFGE